MANKIVSRYVIDITHLDDGRGLVEYYRYKDSSVFLESVESGSIPRVEELFGVFHRYDEEKAKRWVEDNPNWKEKYGAKNV